MTKLIPAQSGFSVLLMDDDDYALQRALPVIAWEFLGDERAITAITVNKSYHFDISDGRQALRFPDGRIMSLLHVYPDHSSFLQERREVWAEAEQFDPPQSKGGTDG